MPHSDLAEKIKVLVQGALSGDVRSVSRLITLVENEAPGHEQAYSLFYPKTGNAKVIGITGPPGGGKSTLVDKYASRLRALGNKVGVIAVDPTSPFTGGAVLGDRVRMQRHNADPGVFIRSMGTRGHLGGLSRGTSAAVDVLDAAGYDYVLIETVGVGQSEIEISSLADLVVLLNVPGLGDEIQIIKAGIMEIGDVFVVNKMDKPGADRTKAELEYALDLGYALSRRPKVLMTNAETSEGVDELVSEVEDYHSWLKETGILKQRRAKHAELVVTRMLSDRLIRRLGSEGEDGELARRLYEAVSARQMTPLEAAQKMFSRILDKGGLS
ncbi:MAG TPA: methylmalonyl Co-A mutase-associated GTPase MeaB [Bacillota bacterium]|nr:methylmalonyl Co-A mutase-associated GTPase MeaB [Bacillota bacterium]HOA15043.1 methylmalonyl Co-A mutase-associated GTPase MeaB [Bacillota bacterium]HOG52786.1 methylmalonyl Co-A mutase-associated GTPase MeaB [Bacillota bacterium]